MSNRGIDYSIFHQRSRGSTRNGQDIVHPCNGRACTMSRDSKVSQARYYHPLRKRTLLRRAGCMSDSCTCIRVHTLSRPSSTRSRDFVHHTNQSDHKTLSPLVSMHSSDLTLLTPVH